MGKYAPDTPPNARYSACDVCGGDPFGCECPECPQCGSSGDPRCFVGGGKGCQPLSLASRSALSAVVAAAKERLLRLLT